MVSPETWPVLLWLLVPWKGPGPEELELFGWLWSRDLAVRDAAAPAAKEEEEEEEEEEDEEEVLARLATPEDGAVDWPLCLSRASPAPPLFVTVGVT